MKAFVEILSGIIRAGPECEKYGDDYDYAVTFSVTDGKTAIIKALISPDKERLNERVTPAHWLAAARALKQIGLKADWERIKDVQVANHKWYLQVRALLRRAPSWCYNDLAKRFT